MFGSLLCKLGLHDHRGSTSFTTKLRCMRGCGHSSLVHSKALTEEYLRGFADGQTHEAGQWQGTRDAAIAHHEFVFVGLASNEQGRVEEAVAGERSTFTVYPRTTTAERGVADTTHPQDEAPNPIFIPAYVKRSDLPKATDQ